MTTEMPDHFRVVVNHEEQYSIYPAALPLPAGWTAVGEPAPRQDCLQSIEAIWRDLRPKSLRDAMAGRR